MRYSLILFFVIFLSNSISSQDILIDPDLSNTVWNLWLDTDANWKNDKLFLPPVDIKKLPINEPSCGWEALENNKGKQITIPATVEQYFWGDDGGSFGITGNYVGVSWFTTNISIPSEWQGKRIVLDFESVRLRAEIYVNRKIVGYDLINGTPFSVDISAFVIPGQTNTLAVRITDPNGNFAWRDWETFMWGDYQIPPSHGFGGITGKVKLHVGDNTFIEDVFVKNKPQLNEVDLDINLQTLKKTCDGKLVITLFEKGKSKKLLENSIPVNTTGSTTTIPYKITYKEAKKWSVEEPNLYTVNVNWLGNDGSKDEFSRTFGFRWFEVKDVAGDKQFYLNDKRIVLRTAISWGHWPINGIFPTAELAKKQIETAKILGLNMLNFHRGIGQNIVFDYADELGLLYYEEPGGYRPGEGDEFAMAFKREKLLRMVKRDRNHPSLIIYNMINESNREPEANEIQDIQDAHELDETRIITFTSTFFGKNLNGGKPPLGEAKVKMHMLPYQDEVKYQGWFDQHHAGGPGSYKDDFYNSPTDFLRYLNHPNEIIFWGEEGAIGTPPRLELVNEAFAQGGNNGWDGDTYRKMFLAYDDFLTQKGFRTAFPSVDALTTSMGQVSHYYQGRIIENIRIGNLGDGYAVNGWESTKVENHSGIVDIFRNPKTDPGIMAYYNQPLYIAVKLREKVTKTGDPILADFFIVNEKDLKGKHVLEVSIVDENGTSLAKKVDVDITGGSTFGELLFEALEIVPKYAGYTFVNATLKKGNTIVATGTDAIYGVNIHSELSATRIAVLDTSGVMQTVLKSAGINAFNNINRAEAIKENVLLVGDQLQPGLELGQIRMNDPLLDWVAEGNTMLIITEPENWCEYLAHKEVLDYRGYYNIGKNWFGGNYFVRSHPYFSGLPTNTAFNWEYQCLAGYKMHRVGLRIKNDECIVGINADHKHEVFSAVSIINHGRGKIVLSTLDLSNAILNNEKNSVVAKKILQNMILQESEN